MSNKLIEHGQNLALIIDKPILKKLKFDKNTDLELVVEDNALIIRPCKRSEKKPHTDSDEEIDKIGDEILEKYKSVFDRLSKS